MSLFEMREIRELSLNPSASLVHIGAQLVNGEYPMNSVIFGSLIRTAWEDCRDEVTRSEP